jgi:hypothetical protein
MRPRKDKPTSVFEKNPSILGIDGVLPWIKREANRDRIVGHLDSYLRTFAGRQFEWFVAKAEVELRIDPGARVNPFHILAAESLSVRVPANAARSLLEPDPERDELIDQARSTLGVGKDTLWTCEPSLLTGDKHSPSESGVLFRLYYYLRSREIGPVTTSKLLAAMFPRVVPIRDSLITAILDLPNIDDWWSQARQLFLAEEMALVSILDGLPLPTSAGAVTTLRRLDIILWMEAKARNVEVVHLRDSESGISELED